MQVQNPLECDKIKRELYHDEAAHENGLLSALCEKLIRHGELP